MLKAPPGEACGDNHPLENRLLMLIGTSLMTHNSTKCIVKLGAVRVQTCLSLSGLSYVLALLSQKSTISSPANISF